RATNVGSSGIGRSIAGPARGTRAPRRMTTGRAASGKDGRAGRPGRTLGRTALERTARKGRSKRTARRGRLGEPSLPLHVFFFDEGGVDAGRAALAGFAVDAFGHALQIPG